MYKTLFIAISPKGKSKSLVFLENGGTTHIKVKNVLSESIICHFSTQSEALTISFIQLNLPTSFSIFSNSFITSSSNYTMKKI